MRSSRECKNLLGKVRESTGESVVYDLAIQFLSGHRTELQLILIKSMSYDRKLRGLVFGIDETPAGKVTTCNLMQVS
jgi:hypothetical protein